MSAVETSSSDTALDETKTDQKTVRPRADRLLFFFLVLVFAVLGLRSFLKSSPLFLSDSGVFTEGANASIFSAAFWFGQRPFIALLFFKMAGASGAIITSIQLVFWLSSWSMAAWLCSSVHSTRWIRFLSFGVLLMFGLSSEIFLWNRTVLSESISLSGFAFFVAASVFLLRNWSKKHFALWTAAALAWVFTRDTNAWSLLFCALVCVACAIPRRPWRLRAAAAFGTALILFLMSNYSVNRSARWLYPFMDSFQVRVLPVPEYRNTFASAGMPDVPELNSLSGKGVAEAENRVFKDTSFAPLVDWIRFHGRSAYSKVMLRFPKWALFAPVREWKKVFTPNFDQYLPAGFKQPLPSIGSKLVYLNQPMLFWVWVASVLVVTSVLLFLKMSGLDYVVPVALVLASIPTAFLVWHADSLEIERHAVQVGVMLRLGIWQLFFLSLDAILLRARPVKPLSVLSGQDLIARPTARA